MTLSSLKFAGVRIYRKAQICATDKLILFFVTAFHWESRLQLPKGKSCLGYELNLVDPGLIYPVGKLPLT